MMSDNGPSTCNKTAKNQRKKAAEKLRKKEKARRNAEDKIDWGSSTDILASSIAATSLEEECFYVIKETTDNRGKGMFAANFIPKGSCILREASVLAIDDSGGMIAIESIFRALSPTNQKAYISLHEGCTCYYETCKETPVLRRFSVNAIARSPDGEPDTIYITASRINHSCLPNATYGFRRDREVRIYAKHNIQQGEEITISYVHFDYGNVKQRRETLSRRRNFICRCRPCLTQKTVFSKKNPDDEDLFQPKQTTQEIMDKEKAAPEFPRLKSPLSMKEANMLLEEVMPYIEKIRAQLDALLSVRDLELAQYLDASQEMIDAMERRLENGTMVTDYICQHMSWMLERNWLGFKNDLWDYYVAKLEADWRVAFPSAWRKMKRLSSKAKNSGMIEAMKKAEKGAESTQGSEGEKMEFVTAAFFAFMNLRKEIQPAEDGERSDRAEEIVESEESEETTGGEEGEEGNGGGESDGSNEYAPPDADSKATEEVNWAPAGVNWEAAGYQ